MLKSPYPLYGGPLNRELAEQGVYRTGASRVPPRLGGGNTGIVPPGGVHTGGVDYPYPSTPTGVHTGGPYPPVPSTGVHTGGGLPPSTLPPVHTGGPLPPSTLPPVHTGGPLPPSTLPPVNTGGGLPPSTRPPVQTGGPGQVQQKPAGFSPVDVVNQMVNGLMNGYVGQDARRRGMEMANSRGLLNSSIAAGTSQRAALEALNPYVDQGMGLLRQREQNAFEGEQNDKKVFQQDWLNSRDFNRQFNGALSMIPIQNASQFSQLIAQYAMENPEVYTPDNIAGMSKFFNDNFRNIISQYLGDIDLGGL